jgi:nitrogen regulatory protein PII-like uncharacterized protein
MEVTIVQSDAIPREVWLALSKTPIDDLIQKKVVNNKAFSYITWSKVVSFLYSNGFSDVSWRREIFTKPNIVRIFLSLTYNGKRQMFTFDYDIILTRKMDGDFFKENGYLSPDVLSTATARGMVKCVAINTGFGLSLWNGESPFPVDVLMEDEDIEKALQYISERNLTAHDIKILLDERNVAPMNQLKIKAALNSTKGNKDD